MWKLLQIELFKIFKRPRTYIAFIAITALVGIIQTGLLLDGEAYIGFMLRDLSVSFDVEGNVLNGYLVCFIILQLLLVHVPLLISLIAGDLISGEANMGTLRLLLTKPISRTEVVMAKFGAAAVYTLLLLVWMAILGLFVSMFLFGTDDMLNLKSGYIVQLKSYDIFWRYLCAFGFAALAMLTVAALGFFCSMFAENSIGPIVATMSVIIVFTILSTLDIPIFNAIKPFLFTTHMIGWKGFFDVQVTEDNEAIIGSVQNLGSVLEAAAILALHIVGLLLASLFVFKKKDVLS
ncbi:ABC transporter permease [Aridibaculum aurantiacum]|uniref:ABC transporter permease n=1 Tax=Aridibaculum aurantiacum TaxID=2810307 RepID=UPI001A961769|nr:ABC transporter permease [Aridibaculum aurantiacum]